jgi:hypothetical protein
MLSSKQMNMKNKFLILGLLLAFIVACDNLTDLNIDKKNPTSVSGESLFVSAEKNLVDQITATNVNYSAFRFFAQYWTETTYTEEANYDLHTRNCPQQHWDELFRRTLANLKESAKVIPTQFVYPTHDDTVARDNKLVIIEILSVYAYSVLVETFGNVPYSQALDVTILNPPYDDALTVYRDLIARLNTAIDNLDTSVGSFTADEDNIYNGDTEKWLKFANSLRLRMGLILSDVASESALAKSAIESSAAGAILDNADNATMEYQGAIPNTNPLYADQVASNRQDYLAANTIVDTMNAYNDPRRPFYFDDNVRDSVTNAVIYSGAPYGEATTYAKYSHVNDKMRLPTAIGTIMSASETEFLLAEAVEKGYNVGGTAAEHYTRAITLSILEWGGSQADADTYVAQPAVAYSTAAGTWQQKIGTQAWVALYNRGFEAWTSWRKLDFPLLYPGPSALSDIPVRYTYPVNEQTVNPDAYDQAAAAIGGDDVATKLFFDIH